MTMFWSSAIATDVDSNNSARCCRCGPASTCPSRPVASICGLTQETAGNLRSAWPERVAPWSVPATSMAQAERRTCAPPWYNLTIGSSWSPGDWGCCDVVSTSNASDAVVSASTSANGCGSACKGQASQGSHDHRSHRVARRCSWWRRDHRQGHVELQGGREVVGPRAGRLHDDARLRQGGQLHRLHRDQRQAG